MMDREMNRYTGTLLFIIILITITSFTDNVSYAGNAGCASAIPVYAGVEVKLKLVENNKWLPRGV
jgi:hypothetical protein